MKREYAPSISLARQIQVYPKPRIFMMFVAEADMLLRKHSEHASRVLEKHYDGLTPTTQRSLIEHYEKIKKK